MTKTLFAILIIVSVGIKVSLRVEPYTLGTQATAEQKIAAFLVSEGFTPGEVVNSQDLPLMSAVEGDCRVLVAIMSPVGDHEDHLRQLAPPGNQVLVVVDGDVYDRQPRLRTWAVYSWERVNLSVGRRVPGQVVLGVIGSPACDLGGVRWKHLGRQLAS